MLETQAGDASNRQGHTTTSLTMLTDSAVQANREAPTLEFKSNKDEIVRSSTTAALAAKFTPDNDMEEEVADLLRAAGAHTGEAVEEAEEALALKASN